MTNITRTTALVLAFIFSTPSWAELSSTENSSRQVSIGAQYLKAGNISQAIKPLKHASNNSPKARLLLGYIYAGYTKPKYEKLNGHEAVKWLESVVKDPSMEGTQARFALAEMYRDGQAVSMNYDKSLFWFVATSVAPSPPPPGLGIEEATQRNIRNLSSRTSQSALEIMDQARSWSYSANPNTRAAETDNIRNWARNGK